MPKTNTTSPAARMDAAAIVTTAAAILKKYGTISEIKTHAAALREKFGAASWPSILKECKEIRGKDIDRAAKDARGRVFSYAGVLGTQFAALQRDKNFKTLCKYAAATYKGIDADTAAALVRDYYTNIDAATGAPLIAVRYIDTAAGARAGLIYVAYQPAKLDAGAAIRVLKTALYNMKRAAKKTARKEADTARAAIDNARTAGTIAAVFASVGNIDGTYSTGAALTGSHAKKEDPAAVALLGHAVPASAVSLVLLNSEARAAYNKTARAALREKMDAAREDAAAAGVKTTAPATKTRAKKTPAAVAAAAGIDAFIEAQRAAAAAGEIELNA